MLLTYYIQHIIITILVNLICNKGACMTNYDEFNELLIKKKSEYYNRYFSNGDINKSMQDSFKNAFIKLASAQIDFNFLYEYVSLLEEKNKYHDKNLIQQISFFKLLSLNICKSLENLSNYILQNIEYKKFM